MGWTLTVLDASSNVVRASVGLGCLQVHIVGAGWRVEFVERMHRCNLL